jgi:hypothetical protein
MASTIKVTDIAYPGSANTAITINANDSVSMNGGVVSPQTGFKNRIINGAMTIDQRNAGASSTAVNNTYYLDRWNAVSGAASKFSIQQNAGAVTPPVGFVNYLGCTSLSAYTVGAAENFGVRQFVEGFNASDLGWGTANASTVTVSFWVYSSLTGTFGGSISNNAANRSYPFTYTISAANTWEQKSVTIAGDTTGTWEKTNLIGIRINFGLGVGSTNSGTAGAWSGVNYFSATGATSVVGTSGATFYITGVQLEKGSTATPFEFRAYGQELGLCKRYYQKNGSGMHGHWSEVTNTLFFVQAQFRFDMRASPTIGFINSTALVLRPGVASYNASAISATDYIIEFTTTAAGLGLPGYVNANAVSFSAEL